MDWNRIYNDFPVNRKMIWLNNCGTTPAGNHIVKNLQKFMDGYAKEGLLTQTFPYPKVKYRIKKILSELLHCKPEELALIHNTAEGMNIFSHGLDLKAGDEIILLENEYPSNYYPWLHLEEKGVKRITTPMRESPDAFLESFKHRITGNTRAVSLSAVHWCTGMPLPIEQIGELCEANQIFFILDGAQGVGIQPINVKKAKIHGMAFSAWKWLMGPLGLGVLYVDENKLDDVGPVFIGTDSVIDAEHYLPYKSQLKKDTDRFVYSTANYIDWVYFLSSLEYLADIGFDRIRDRIFELSGYLSEQLEEIGFNLLNRSFSDVSTGIVVGRHQQLSTPAIMQHLNENKIVSAERLGNLRFSPHIYTAIHQIDNVIDILRNF